MATRDNLDPDKRLGGSVIFYLTAIGTLALAWRVIAAELFLILHYGFVKVWDEKLYLVSMNKAKPWIVSNGDQITEGQFICFLLTCVVWFALFLLVYPLLYRRLLPKNNASDGK